MKNIYFTYFPSVKKNILGINRALVAKKNLASLSVICLSLLCGVGNVWAASPLTVEGTSATNEWVPVYGYYADNFLHSQIIYPKGDLAEMDGKIITSLKFYTTSSYANVSWGSARFQIRLKLVDASTLSGFVDVSSVDPVYIGELSVSGQEMTITLTEEFEYDKSKNLLFDLQSTAKGSWKKVSFYGSTVTGASKGGYSSTSAAAVSPSSSADNFRPKTTFAYVNPPTCKKPNLSLEDKGDTYVSFSWTAGKDETQWQYCYKNGSTLPSSSDWSSPTTNTMTTISGLTASTKYTFYLRAYCSTDDQSAASELTFTTECKVISTLPWNSDEDIASGTYMGGIDCWGRATTNVGYYSGYYINNTTPKRWYFYGNNGKTDAQKNHKAIIILPKFTTDIQQLKVSVKYSTGGTATKYPGFHIGYVAAKDIDNISTFSDASKFVLLTSLPKTSNTGTYTTSTPYAMSSAPKGAYIAIAYHNNTTTSNNESTDYTGYIEKIIVEATQDCSKPSTPVASDVTGNSAHLSWTAKTGVTSYKYIYKTTSSAPTLSEWESASTTSNTYVDLSALTDGTTYYFWVMCSCGTVASDPCTFTPLSCPSVTGVTLTNKLYNGVTVNWTTSSYTDCDVRFKAGSGAWTSAGTGISGTSKAITGLSVGTTYTFEVKPSCSADGWAAAGETYTPTCPAVGALTLSGQKYNGVTINWSAVVGISTYNLRYRKGSDAWTTVNDIAALTYTITSGLVTNQEYSIEVQTECGSTWSSTTYTPIAADPAVVSVNSITETTATPTWTDMSAEGATGYKYILVDRDAVVDWSAATSVNSVTFSASLSGLTLGTDYDVYVQTIYPGPIYSDGKKRQFTTDVNKPTGLTRGTLTSTSVQFSWTAGGGATQYQYLCLPSGTTPNETHWSSSTLTGLTSVTVEGLTPNTKYVFHVRAYYNGKVSTKVSSEAFTTPCGTEDLPYSQNFGTSDDSNVPACWTIVNWNASSGNYWYRYTENAYTSHALRYLARYTAGKSADAITPQIYISDKSELSFYIRNWYGSTSSATTYVQCNVIITDVDANTSVDISTALGINTYFKVPTQKTYDLSAYKGKTITITFRGNTIGTSATGYLWIDDVAITAKSCTTPTANTPTVTYNTATVTWTDSRAEEWSVRYRTYNVGAWTEVNGLTSKTYTMTGLTTDTEYEVQVQNDCASGSSGWTTSERFIPTCAVPGTPVFSSATPEGGHVAWTAAGSGVTIYQYCVVARDAEPDWSGNLTTTNTYVDLTGLIAGAEYTFYVRSKCAAGVFCDPVSCEVDPTCPTPTFDFSDETVTTVRVNYHAGGGETAWNLRWRREAKGGHPASSWSYENNIAIGTTYHTITDLEYGYDYQIEVQAACQADWNTGVVSNIYTPTITSPTPTITPYDCTAYVVWDDVLIATGYEYVCVPRDAACDWNDATYISESPLTITGLAPSTEYDLHIRSTYGLLHGLHSLTPFTETFTTTKYAPISLTNTATTSFTATFTWSINVNSSVTQYQWACKPGSATPSAGDWSAPISVRTATVSELSDNTDYTFYVRSYYGEGVYSNYTSIAFTTLCAAKTLPYYENFGTVAGAKPGCWTCANWASSTNGYWYTHQITYGSDYGVRMYATSSGHTGDLTTPGIILSEPAELSFKYANHYSGRPMTAKVIISNGVTTKEIELPITADDDLEDTYVRTPINLANVDGTDFTGSTITITFRGISTVGGTSYFDLDDVKIETKTWILTGTANSGAWSTLSNWNKGVAQNRVPNINDNVILRKPAVVDIPHAAAKSIIIDQYDGSTGKLTVNARKGLEVAGTITRTTDGENRLSTRPEDLVLGSSASGNASLIFDNSNSNQAGVSMYSKAFIDGEGVKNYQYIGVPVAEANAYENYYGSWLYSWSDKGSGYGWKKVPFAATVYAWTGYCITQEAPVCYFIKGTLVPTTSQDIAVPAGENMVVGNSWTAPIDINALTTDDLEGLVGNIYFFNTGVDKKGEAGAAGARYAGSTYVTIPVEAAKYAGEDDYISSLQGFFVKNTSGSAGTLHLNYAKHVRAYTRGSIIGDALHAPKRTQNTDMDEPVVLKIKVSGENYDDKLVLLAREDFSEGFDNGWDGDKWDGNESAQYIYTPDSEGTENSVSAVPELEGTVIGFRAGEDDEYTMYFDYLNGDEKLYLWDTETGDYTVIKTGYAYAFTTADKEKHARFIITRSNGMEVATGVENVQSDKGQGTKARKLLIEDKLYIMVDGVLFDATGKLVK